MYKIVSDQAQAYIIMALQFIGTLICLQLVAVCTITVSARASHLDDQREQQWLDAVKDLLRKYEGTAGLN